MNKVEAILADLKNIDGYIETLIRRRDKIEASLLSSPKWTVDKVTGGLPKRQDDIYVELITTRQNIEKKSAEAIRLREKLESYIDSVPDIYSRSLLSMFYIEKMDRYDICDQEGFEMSTFYRRLGQAKEQLAIVCK